jgi:hypothetical protein
MVGRMARKMEEIKALSLDKSGQSGMIITEAPPTAAVLRFTYK